MGPPSPADEACRSKHPGRVRLAVEQDRLEELRGLLAAGADIPGECKGFALLHRAVDEEATSMSQAGGPSTWTPRASYCLKMQIPGAVVRGSA